MHKWSLVYDGKEKLYTLTEYQMAGDKWYQVSETQWSYIDAPLEHIRKVNELRLKDQGRQG